MKYHKWISIDEYLPGINVNKILLQLDDKDPITVLYYERPFPDIRGEFVNNRKEVVKAKYWMPIKPLGTY